MVNLKEIFFYDQFTEIAIKITAKLIAAGSLDKSTENIKLHAATKCEVNMRAKAAK